MDPQLKQYQSFSTADGAGSGFSQKTKIPKVNSKRKIRSIPVNPRESGSPVPLSPTAYPPGDDTLMSREISNTKFFVTEGESAFPVIPVFWDTLVGWWPTALFRGRVCGLTETE